jgi:hypothetical protein
MEKADRSFVEEEAPSRKTYMSRRQQKPWSSISRRLNPGMAMLAKPAAV